MIKWFYLLSINFFQNTIFPIQDEKDLIDVFCNEYLQHEHHHDKYFAECITDSNLTSYTEYVIIWGPKNEFTEKIINPLYTRLRYKECRLNIAFIFYLLTFVFRSSNEQSRIEKRNKNILSKISRFRRDFYDCHIFLLGWS